MLFFLNPIFAQTKNEKEKRIQFSDLPKQAQTIISNLPEDCKRLKYFSETDGDKQSFEVKFKFNKKHFSLEFSEDGQIEDIEVLIKLKNIEDSIKTQIKTYFNQTFNKHKLIKIQRQYGYKSNENDLQFVSDVLSQKSEKAADFEIIAEVKSNKQRDIREFTFNNKGEFLNFRILIQSSYEHVLY